MFQINERPGFAFTDAQYGSTLRLGEYLAEIRNIENMLDAFLDVGKGHRLPDALRPVPEYKQQPERRAVDVIDTSEIESNLPGIGANSCIDSVEKRLLAMKIEPSRQANGRFLPSRGARGWLPA